MKPLLVFLISLLPITLSAQTFSCPTGQADTMKYFVMGQDRRAHHFMDGKPNPIYTQVFPDTDFAAKGYWFWVKSSKAHGFDVKAFDEKYVYMRSTELDWKDNTSFKFWVVAVEALQERYRSEIRIDQYVAKWPAC